ncbi:MAG: SAM-dependent methyltransferase, partial [Candidatus Humimicrobiaceae bacterium]
MTDLRGKLYGIGVGPGDPELITLKAARILKEVACIAAPKSSSEKKSLAISVIEKLIQKDKEILELVFPMSLDNKLLQHCWNESANLIKEKLDTGTDVAFITLGDPAIYSTYIHLQENIKKNG